jgi:hypothetical protein
MGRRARSRRVFLILPIPCACALAVLACGAGDSLGGIGVSGPRPIDTHAAIVDAGSDVASPVPADFRTTMTRVAGKQASHGHADRYDVVVWANDGARSVWDSDAEMPDGSMLVEELSEHVRGGEAAAGFFAMQKSAGSWRFFAVSPRGVVGADATVATCDACHRDAPHDHVFRIPATSPAPTDAGADR